MAVEAGGRIPNILLRPDHTHIIAGKKIEELLMYTTGKGRKIMID